MTSIAMEEVDSLPSSRLPHYYHFSPRMVPITTGFAVVLTSMLDDPSPIVYCMESLGLRSIDMSICDAWHARGQGSNSRNPLRSDAPNRIRRRDSRPPRALTWLVRISAQPETWAAEFRCIPSLWCSALRWDRRAQDRSSHVTPSNYYRGKQSRCLHSPFPRSQGFASTSAN